MCHGYTSPGNQTLWGKLSGRVWSWLTWGDGVLAQQKRSRTDGLNRGEFWSLFRDFPAPGQHQGHRITWDGVARSRQFQDALCLMYIVPSILDESRPVYLLGKWGKCCAKSNFSRIVARPWTSERLNPKEWTGAPTSYSAGWWVTHPLGPWGSDWPERPWMGSDVGVYRSFSRLGS